MRRFTYILLSALALCSCAKESEMAPQMSLEASIGGSKVQLDSGMKTVWNSGDQVSVSSSSQNECWGFSGSNKTSNGKLVPKGESTCSGEIHALYPYDSKTRFGSGKASISLSSSQVYMPESYSSTWLAGKTGGKNIIFHYLMSMVVLELSGEAEIGSISIRSEGGEPLCGNAEVDFSSDIPSLKMASSGTGKEISIVNGKYGDMAIKGGTERFWCSIPPARYSKGFTLTVSLKSGSRKTIRHTAETTLKAGQVLLIEDAVEDYEKLYVKFADNPQTESSILYNFPTQTLMASKGTVDAQKTYSFGTQYDFVIWAKCGFSKATSGGGAQINHLQINPEGTTGTGVSYGGKGYAWIKLPGIEGKTLRSVELNLSGTSSGNTLNISSAVGTDGKGNENQAMSTNASSSMSLYLSNPSSGASYYLCTGNQSNTNIVDMTLSYSKF